MKKYELKLSHLDDKAAVHKLERDGFTRHDIHRVLYKEAGDASNYEREKIMQKVYDRQQGEK